jgi:hypothetical protein
MYCSLFYYYKNTPFIVLNDVCKMNIQFVYSIVTVSVVTRLRQKKIQTVHTESTLIIYYSIKPYSALFFDPVIFIKIGCWSLRRK